MSIQDNPLELTNFILWIANTIFLCFLAIISYKSTKSLEGKEEFYIKSRQTWTYFFIIMFIMNIIMIIWKFFIKDQFIIDILERISNTLFYVAIFIKIQHIEKSINRLEVYKGYYFSITLIIICGITALVDPDYYKYPGPFQVIAISIAIVGFAIFPIIYFLITLKSKGEIRVDAFMISAGAVFLALGYLFRPSNLVYYRITPTLNMLIDWLYITSPISIIIGSVLIFISFRKI
ncbi:MAG: hypothetical protein ACTSRZ_01805 [Promethearchaeota archaeon]